MTKTCNNCGVQFKWKEPYDGDKMNLDGTPHVCQTKITQSAPSATVPIDRTAVITEIKEFLLAFPIKQDVGNMLYTPDELDVASRIYISRTMRR